MATTNGGHGPRTDRRALNRQLTLGECIAIARYGEHWMDAESGRVGLGAILCTIDRLGVCTTCGWSKATHQTKAKDAQALGICAQWERFGVHE